MKTFSKNKVVSSSLKAISEIKDEAIISIGGFGGVGIPANLLAALLNHNVQNLTIVSNHAGQGEQGLAALINQIKEKKPFPIYIYLRT